MGVYRLQPVDRLIKDHAHSIPEESFKDLAELGLLDDHDSSNWLLSAEEQYILDHYGR